MSTLVWILSFLPAAIFAGMGYLIRFRGAYWLISGYNTMPAEKREKVDTHGLGILIGNMCFLMGALMSAGILLILLRLPTVGFTVMGLVIPVIIYTLVTAQKYDGNNFDSSGTMKTAPKIIIGAVIVGLLLVLGFACYGILQGFKPVSAAITGSTLTIAGSYGQSIPLEDIRSIRLDDTLPDVLMRTNGSAIGSVLRGHFRLAETGAAMLYLDKSKPPFLRIETASQIIYLNLPSDTETRQLFEALKEKTGG